MRVKNIFWNSGELRIRACWRIISQLILVAILTNVFTFADKLLKDFLPANPSVPGFSYFQPLELFLAVFLSMLVSAKYFDKRPFTDFGFKINKKWFEDFSAGLILGIILMSLIFAVEYAAGWITITGYYEPANNNFSFEAGIISGTFMFLCVGFYEEMQVRGYLLKNLSEGFNFNGHSQKGILTALVISSLIFGLGHASNPNVTFISLLSITLAGLLLATGYLITGRLAIPIGLHISWNFFQGYVFGFPVSGITTASSIVVIQQGGPEIWTGGAFGPEAGLIGIVSYFIGIGLIVIWVKFKDKSVAAKTEIAEYKL